MLKGKDIYTPSHIGGDEKDQHTSQTCQDGATNKFAIAVDCIPLSCVDSEDKIYPKVYFLPV